MDAPDLDQGDDRYEAMLDRVDTVLSAFTDSTHFEELTGYQQRETSFVVKTVAELLYGYEDTTLEECDRSSLETICTRIYPEKVSVEPDHFGAVAPVMEALFRFLADSGSHPDGESLAAHVESLEDEIITAAVESSNRSAPPSAAMGDVDSGLSVDWMPGVAADQGEMLAEGPGTELQPEELQAVDEALDSLSDESRDVLVTVTDALLDPEMPGSRDAIFETIDVTSQQYQEAMDEALETLEDRDAFGISGDDQNPSVLDSEQAERFLELYGRLLVYVNNRFQVVPGIDTFESFRMAFLDEVQPIRDHLYHETNTEAIISEFVAENPADLSDSALSQVEEWTAYEAGQFAIVDHQVEKTVFLDPNQPRVYGVTAVHEPFSASFPSYELPIPVSDVVLLPFEGTIVTDGWLRPDLILLGAWDMMLDTDLEALDEEARHRHGIAESLPPEEDSERSDVEKLRYYTKNKTNRERFSEEIQRLKNESTELARIYHKQVGKGRARSLGREFRDLGLEEAYVAIYGGQVVATAPTESALEETLGEIMPEGVAEHPYVYHYDP